MNPSSLAVFVFILNPKSHLIPGCLGFVCRQIAHHTDGLLIALLPPYQHRPAHPISFLTPFAPPFPLSPRSLDSLSNAAKRFFPLCPKRESLFDPQERMPPIGLDRLIQPGRIQPPVGHHQHRPLRWHHVGQLRCRMRSQWGRHSPSCLPVCIVQATLIPHPRYIRLHESTVKRSVRVLASRASTSVFSPSHPLITPRNRSANTSSTTISRRFFCWFLTPAFASFS